ncbi:MAG: FAD-dependent oxidoreductase [Pseudomonadota bacterium]
MKASVDVTIVGFGLAGAAIAWALHERGLRLRVFDANLDGASSKVAAGLITPVTGKKLKPESNFLELRKGAVAHYRSIERLAGVHCLSERPALRMLESERELAALDRTTDAPLELMQQGDTSDWTGFRTLGQVLLMPLAARLDTRAYLDASWQALSESHEMLQTTPDDIDGPVVWCCGFRESLAERAPTLQWRPAKGEIVVIHSDRLGLPGTLHARGIWITPDGDGQFLAGATYSWDVLDGHPTKKAREQLTGTLDAVLETPYTITSQRAGVRPIVQGRKPVIGRLNCNGPQWIFNGLGSKGSLYAPGLGELLAEQIVNDSEVPASFDYRQRIDDS